MVDVKVHSLFLHFGVVVEGNAMVFGTLGVGEDGVSLDLPEGHFHVVREDKGHPIVVH